jgi:hypothetical protein
MDINEPTVSIKKKFNEINLDITINKEEIVQIIEKILLKDITLIIIKYIEIYEAIRYCKSSYYKGYRFFIKELEFAIIFDDSLQITDIALSNNDSYVVAYKNIVTSSTVIREACKPKCEIDESFTLYCLPYSLNGSFINKFLKQNDNSLIEIISPQISASKIYTYMYIDVPKETLERFNKFLEQSSYNNQKEYQYIFECGQYHSFIILILDVSKFLEIFNILKILIKEIPHILLQEKK